MSDTTIDRTELLSLTAEIVSAHVGNNAVGRGDIAALIQSVFGTLNGLGTDEAAPAALTPAVPIKRSVTDDYIVCLEDGKKLKMLKRHLMTAYGMTPEEYRAKWSLKADYPTVAPNSLQAAGISQEDWLRSKAEGYRASACAGGCGQEAAGEEGGRVSHCLPRGYPTRLINRARRLFDEGGEGRSAVAWPYRQKQRAGLLDIPVGAGLRGEPKGDHDGSSGLPMNASAFARRPIVSRSILVSSTLALLAWLLEPV